MVVLKAAASIGVLLALGLYFLLSQPGVNSAFFGRQPDGHNVPPKPSSLISIGKPSGAEAGRELLWDYNHAAEGSSASGRGGRSTPPRMPTKTLESEREKWVNIGEFVDVDNPSGWDQFNDAKSRNVGAAVVSPDDESAWFEQDDVELTNIGGYADPEDFRSGAALVEMEPKNIGPAIDFEQPSELDSVNIGDFVDPPK